MGALRAPSGPSDDDVTWPMSLPVEFCSIGFNLNPFGTSVPTGPFGALRAPWGPCGPLRGPLMTMWRGLCHSLLNDVRLDSIWTPSVHQFRRAPSGPFGPHGGPADPFGALWWRCDVAYVTPGWILFDWIQFEPLRYISSDGPLRGPAGPFGALWWRCDFFGHNKSIDQVSDRLDAGKWVCPFDKQASKQASKQAIKQSSKQRVRIKRKS